MDKYIAPSEIRVGFNKRRDTFTNMLGFMIYRNKADGTYGYEKSFSGWIDEKIPEKFIFNNFQSGFVINRGEKRFHSYGGNVKIRVYHPDGFEFEIPLDNLALILHNCTLEKATIVENCIVTWSGSNVYLIPEVLKEQVEFKNIIELKEKLNKRKLIPASACKRFGFYNGSEGEEFNLGKLPVYSAEKKESIICLVEQRCAQVSIPASCFVDSPGLEKPIYKSFIGTKKFSELQVNNKIKESFENLKKDIDSSNSCFDLHEKNKSIKKFTLKYAESRLRCLVYKDINIFESQDEDLVEVLLKASIECKNYASIIIPIVFNFKNIEYFFLISKFSKIGNADNLFYYYNKNLVSLQNMDNKRSELVKNKGLEFSKISVIDLNVCLVSKENFSAGNNLINLNEALELPSLECLYYMDNIESDYIRKNKELVNSYNIENINNYLNKIKKLA